MVTVLVSQRLNEGMYRAGPAVGGLPLPRARLGAFTAAVAVVSVLAFLFPWILLFSGGPARGWETFKNGGLGMWFLALLDVALPIALGVAGAFAVRGKRVPAGLFFGIAVIPLFFSFLFAFYAMRKIESALFWGGGIDPSFAMRIHAQGTAETFSLDIFGGYITCGAALIGSIALASAVGSIDVVTATRSEGRPPSSVFGAATLVSGAAWFVATLVITALRIRTVSAIAICAVLVVGLLVPFAVFAARAAPVLRRWHDPLEARRASGALVVAALTGLLAILVLERAVLARVGADILSAVSGESIDPSQKARILMELVVARKWTSIAYGVHAVLGGATFALAIAGSVGASATSFRHPASPSTVMAASVGVFVLAAAFALGVARARATDRMTAYGATQSAPKGITLPVVTASADSGRAGRDGSLALRADGGVDPLTKLPSRACSGYTSTTVYADRMATVEMLAKELGRCGTELYFAAAMEKDAVTEAKLGDLAPFVGTGVATVGGMFYEATEGAAPKSGFGTGYLMVRSLPDDVIAYEDHEVKLPLGPTSPELRSGQYSIVRFVFRPSDTIGHVVRVIVAVKERFRSTLPSYGVTFRLEIEYPPRPMPTDPDVANLPSGIRFLAPIVAGRLPPEVVTRIVRQNAGRIRECYADGAKRDPKLAGTVRVKFVIDRSGGVSTAQDAASTLPDRAVTSCIVRTFGTFSFPQPEGGIVVVTYPMTFAP